MLDINPRGIPTRELHATALGLRQCARCKCWSQACWFERPHNVCASVAGFALCSARTMLYDCTIEAVAVAAERNREPGLITWWRESDKRYGRNPYR